MKSLPGILTLGALGQVALIYSSPALAQDPPTTARVVSVYDGDTVTLDTGDRVRLAHVNTPELRPLEDFAVEAREATEAFVGNHLVTLGYGPTVRDGYGRLVASIRVNGEDLAEHLVEQGLAHVFVIPPAGDDLSALLTAQGRAQSEHLGLWTSPAYTGALHVTSFHANGRGDDRVDVNSEYFRLVNMTTEPLDLAEYRVSDISGSVFDLPHLVVPGGYTVKVHSGVGTDQADPSDQLTVYLGSTWPIWNNDRDRLTITDRGGAVVDLREHAPKSRR